MPLTAAQSTSRRRFIQFLAASPLFAGTSLSALAEEPFPNGRPIRLSGRRATTII